MAAILQGVDYAFPPLPSAAGLAAAGKRFAGRYVGPGFGKFLTAPERDALFANGLDIFLLVEGVADSARGGRPVGREHMRLAVDMARGLGAPVDQVAFYMAVDYDLMTSDWPTAADYLRGGADVVGVDQVGIYGEHDAMVWAARDGVASWFFQTYAWSGGAWYPGNHVEQYLNGQIVAGGEVDLCRSMQVNFGQWVGSGRPPIGRKDMGMHRIRSGIAEGQPGHGSIYLVLEVQQPQSGRMPAFGLDGPRNDQTYASLPLYQLPAGMSVEASGYYDIQPGPWPAPQSGGDLVPHTHPVNVQIVEDTGGASPIEG